MTAKCPVCGQRVKLPNDCFNRRFKCPKCLSRFEVTTEAVVQVGEVETKGPEKSDLNVLAETVNESRDSPRASAFVPASVPRRSRYQKKKRRRPKWVIALVLLVTLFSFSLFLLGVFSWTGLAATKVDVRRVIANPQAYAGRTLTSLVLSEESFMYSPWPGGEDPIVLRMPPLMEREAFRVNVVAGDRFPVMIKYRIHDRNEFALGALAEKKRRRADKAAEERNRNSLAARGLALQPPIGTQSVQGAEASNEARPSDEAEDGTQGTLLNVWIP